MSEPFNLSGPRGDTESPEDFSLRGQYLLSKGEFEEAVSILQDAAELLPNDRRTQLAFAGTLTKLKHSKAARDSYRAFVERNPLGIAPKGRHEKDPLLLVVRGFDKTRPTIGLRTSGEYKPKLRGGHYTIQYLLPRNAVPRQTFTIPGQLGINDALLPDFDVMLNTIAEPDIEGASLTSLQSYLDQNPETSVINKPEPVWQTARDRNYERLNGLADFTFPKTVRFRVKNAGPGEFAQQLNKLDMGAPVILRRVGTQTGRTTQLITGGHDLMNYARKPLSGEFYAISYREILWQGEYFRKLRLFCIDGEYYPVVCHLDKIWNVHGGNRKEIMRNDESLQAQEKAFLANWKDYVGQGNADILYKIAEATNLEFFGIDFTVDNEGKIFIYELNPSMRHSFDHAKNFPYKMPYDQATSDAFEKMVLDRVKTAYKSRRDLNAG